MVPGRASDHLVHPGFLHLRCPPPKLDSSLAVFCPLIASTATFALRLAGYCFRAVGIFLPRFPSPPNLNLFTCAVFGNHYNLHSVHNGNSLLRIRKMTKT